MREKKDRQEKQRVPFSLRKQFAEILVASHTEEPYIIAFRYSADNIASQSLGTFLGFFEVETHDHDAAYVVNFLASVAKKEYFANARRGPVESFEAALHKVNVALSELVKHGNVTWLGHLNGSLAIIVGNTIHFSVAGDGALYLFRNQTLRPISEGLALKEENPHPLKTFVEIASGDLMDHDRVFLFSPSVWTLFTPGDIEKSALRFSPPALEQFLRTALVNELESGAAILVSCEKEIPPPAEEKKPAATQTPLTLPNVFTEAAFRGKEIPPSLVHDTPPPLPEKKEFIDQKTGHIYVQGNDTEKGESLPGRERFSLLWQHFALAGYQLLQKTGRVRRKWKKGILLLGGFLRERSASQFRSWGRKSRSLLRRGKHIAIQAKTGIPERLKKFPRIPSLSFPIRKETEVNREEFPHTQLKPSVSVPSPGISPQASVSPERPVSRLGAWLSRKSDPGVLQKDEGVVDRPSRPRSTSLSDFVEQSLTPQLASIRGIIFRLLGIARNLVASLFAAWKTWSTLSKRIVIASLIIVLFVLVRWIGFSGPNNEVAPVAVPTPPTESVTAPLFSKDNEKGAVELPLPETLLTFSGETVVRTVYLKAVPYLITDTNIINLTTKESVATPNRITQAIDMDDLNTLFLVTEGGSLLAYTPTNKRFSANELPLPSGAAINALGTYLTYLYVFDAEARRLYRFPRSEGGFGAPASWFRENITLAPPITFAVGGIVALGDNDQVMSYERGKVATKTFESPSQKATLDALAVIGEENSVYALDRAHARILRWSEAGSLEQQYFSPELTQSVSFTLSPDQKNLLVDKENSVIRFVLP